MKSKLLILVALSGVAASSVAAQSVGINTGHYFGTNSAGIYGEGFGFRKKLTWSFHFNSRHLLRKEHKSSFGGRIFIASATSTFTDDGSPFGPSKNTIKYKFCSLMLNYQTKVYQGGLLTIVWNISGGLAFRADEFLGEYGRIRKNKGEFSFDFPHVSLNMRPGLEHILKINRDIGLHTIISFNALPSNEDSPFTSGLVVEIGFVAGAQRD